MHIVQHTSNRLIIQSKRGIMAVAMTLFVVFSIISACIIFAYGVQMLTTNFAWWRLLGYLIWQPLSITLVVIGIMFWNNAMRGLTLTFDRDAETVTIRQPAFWRMREQSRSIYSISRMELELIPQARTYAVYLTTRAGEQIPLASISAFDEAPIRAIVKQVRQFLQGEDRRPMSGCFV